jgi:hypothetical protein
MTSDKTVNQTNNGKVHGKSYTAAPSEERQCPRTPEPKRNLPDATAQRRRTKAPKKKGAKDAKAQAASASRHANR